MGNDPFYVGYLDLPRPHRVFLAVALPIAILGMVAGAIGIAREQPTWGDGFWQTGEASIFRGTMVLDPYPMLHVATQDKPRDSSDSVTTYLLVEMGKFGSGERFAEMENLDGASVSIRGRELVRDGRTMIEIDPDNPELGPSVAVMDWDEPAVRALWSKEGRAATFRGEIVDSKCYLGAMKPGAGRGHKACATLCISGGIPPVLISRLSGGGVAYRLLTDSNGDGLDASALARLAPSIGEPVKLSGTSARIGSWEVLQLAPNQFD